MDDGAAVGVDDGMPLDLADGIEVGELVGLPVGMVDGIIVTGIRRAAFESPTLITLATLISNPEESISAMGAGPFTIASAIALIATLGVKETPDEATVMGVQIRREAFPSYSGS